MDNIYVNSRLRVINNQIIHVKRRLPSLKLKVNVRVGEELSPDKILGEGEMAAGFRTIHLARELDVSPKEALVYLKRQVGQTIYQGELLASKEGLWGLKKKIILAPGDGIIDFYDRQKGNLKIKHLPKVSKVVSGVYGIIEDIDYSLCSITIKTAADIVYGVLGSGKEREGLLQILGSPGDLTSSRQISESMHGRIIVCGGIVLGDALEKAVNVGIGGVISGGINAGDFKSVAGGNWNLSNKHWTDVGLTLLVTEGFGAIPIGDDVFTVLKGHHEKFAIIDGNRSRLILPGNDPDSMIYIRRTALPLHPEHDSGPEVSMVPLKQGSKIRIISEPFIGVVGMVESIDKTPTLLSSGISTLMVTVSTKTKKLRLPYLNVEVVS